MMIAIALTLVVMLIIAQTFASATKVFSDLRTAGQLQERTRGAAAVIRRDLEAEHFDGPFTPGLSGPRVGDQRLDRPGWTPPIGYFEIRQFPNALGQTGYVEPMLANGGLGTPDSEGLPSTRADTHVLRFTVKLPDLPAAELFCAELQAAPGAPGEPSAADRAINSFPIGTTLVYSRWAEIEYFLAPSPLPPAQQDVTPGTNSGPPLPLYSLRRRVRLLAPAGFTRVVLSQARAQQLIALYPDVAMADMQQPGPGGAGWLLRVLGPDDVNNPLFRLPYQAISLKPNALGQPVPTGDDVLLTDVLSFEIKAAWFNNQSFNNIFPNSSPNVRPMFPVLPVPPNLEEPFDDLQPVTLNSGPWFGQRVFDTWFRAPSLDALDWDRPVQANAGPGFLNQRPDQVPMRINVRALQIQLRVWDSRKEQARQMTIIQEI